MHKSTLGEIYAFLSEGGWGFQAAKSGVQVPTFSHAGQYDWVKWTNGAQTLEVYSSNAKPNVIILQTNESCIRSISTEFSSLATGKTAVVDEALQTIYENGNTVVLMVSRKKEYQAGEYFIYVYDKTLMTKLNNASNTSSTAQLSNPNRVNFENEEEMPPEDPKVNSNAGKVYTYVEEQPKFPGGEAAMYEYLQKNIKYPPLARENGITGRVYLSFIIGPDGYIRDIRVIRGIGAGCDEEAIRVLKNMPLWIPGKQNGEPVNVKFNMPINFTLKNKY
jgi:TonB family protein